MKSSVVGVIFSEDRKKILLLKRRDVPMWVLPGGGVDEDEKPEEAIIREVFEETGLQVGIVKKIGEYRPINKLSRFTHLFECRAISGAPRTGSETREIGFYALDNIPHPFFIIHQDWLQDALSNTSGLIQKPVPRVTYFNLFKYFLQHPIQVIRLALSRLGLPINQ
jgi:8-oxo-dGTP diphosphatase